MAWTTIGTVAVNTTASQLFPFPSVTLAATKAYTFTLEANPLATKLFSGYFLVIPQVTLQGTLVERPMICKWFPKGLVFAFNVNTFKSFGGNLVYTINLWPIERYPNAATPKALSVVLKYDSANTDNQIITV